ncbi:MAG: hypothetical protein WKF35_08010 [Ferruginibacter sp.]
MKFRFLFFFVLFNSTNAFAQSDSMLVNEAWTLMHPQENSSIGVDSFNLKLDSIYVNVKYNTTKIITNNFFKNSARSIIIEYYFKRDSIKYIQTSEKNFNRPNFDYFSHYYFQNDTLVKDDHGSSRSNVQLGVSYTLDEISKMHSYPNRIDYAFLNKYVFTLLAKLKLEIQLINK